MPPENGFNSIQRLAYPNSKTTRKTLIDRSNGLKSKNQKKIELKEEK